MSKEAPMNRIQWLVKGLALSLIFAGVGGVGLAQERPLQPRGGSNEAQIAQLWQQIGQLYKQIVALEVGDTRLL